MSDLPKYSVVFSDEDNEWVATCDLFPSLSWLDSDPVDALEQLCNLIDDIIDEMSDDELSRHLRLVK